MEEYEEVREDYYAGLEEKRMVTLDFAREHRYMIDFVANPPQLRPKKLGVTVINDYPMREVVKYIDWNPFFATWELRGKYPNRGYPKIFNDATVGEEAKKLFDDAEKMLNEILDQNLLTVRGIVGLYAANAVGDDVELYTDDTRTDVLSPSPVVLFFSLFARPMLNLPAGGGQDVHVTATG
jgi:5-methyltetrahydrofolate--homocysteine methyltransferase